MTMKKGNFFCMEYYVFMKIYILRSENCENLYFA